MNTHSDARTTPKVRAFGLSIQQVMEKYNVAYKTAAKWLERDDVQDKSHHPHTLQPQKVLFVL